MLAFADMVDLFTNELAGLRGRRLPFPLVFTSPPDGFAFRHCQFLHFVIALPPDDWTGDSHPPHDVSDIVDCHTRVVPE
jgi:hypothetical protein